MKSFITALMVAAFAFAAHAQQSTLELIGASALIGTLQSEAGADELTLLVNEDGTVQISTTGAYQVDPVVPTVVKDERAADGSLVLSINGTLLTITNRMDGSVSYILGVGKDGVELKEQMLN